MQDVRDTGSAALGGGLGVWRVTGKCATVLLALEVRERILYFRNIRICKKFCKRYVRECSRHYRLVRVGYCSGTLRSQAHCGYIIQGDTNTVAYYS